MPEKIAFTPELLDSYSFIDVRTLLEFQDDHIPGAHNVPLLTNEERVEIGTIYKQTGPIEARRRGLQLTCSRFYDIVDEIIRVSEGKPVIVYCWRGGLRSGSVAMLLETCGTKAFQLDGGYKAFRNHVIDYFERSDFVAPLIVLHGMTGIGKTIFINGLEDTEWGTIDLEGIACHRGSAFGALGLEQNFTQKNFETNLWNEFRNLPKRKAIVLEGESQRIGKFTLPGKLYEKMGSSCKIWCHASLNTRIKRLADEYAHHEYQQEMLQALERIRKKLPPDVYKELKSKIEVWDVTGIARSLILDYYDRMYYKNRTWTPDFELELEDFSVSESELQKFWENSKSKF